MATPEAVPEAAAAAAAAFAADAAAVCADAAALLLPATAVLPGCVAGDGTCVDCAALSTNNPVIIIGHSVQHTNLWLIKRPLHSV